MAKLAVKPKSRISYDTVRDEGKKKRTWAMFLPLLTFLAACEDEGNAGNDNLLTGGSLVILIIIVVVIYLVVRRRK